MKAVKNELKKLFKDKDLVNNVAGEMQRTVLMGSESIIHRVMSGHIQREEGTEYTLHLRTYFVTSTLLVVTLLWLIPLC